MNPFKIIFLTTALIILVAFTSFKCFFEDSQKINGVSFVAPPRFIDEIKISHLRSINANWVAITPYAFSNSNSPEVSFNHDHQWWGETKTGVVATINYAHNQGHKIMLKPHVWVKGQGWAGDYELETDDQWKVWGESYANYILTYAEIADSLKVEMLCIGTEYRKAVTLHPEIWRNLIKDVRQIYGGKVVYAANWDNYQNVTFWDDLDFIGIDAYFPLTEEKSPEIAHLKDKWDSISVDIQKFSKKWDKSILFTEFGYQSVDYSTDGHWKYEQDTLSINLDLQANAYQALFETFWDKPWFDGGFFWKWHSDHERIGGLENKEFTPQNKPAQETIRQWYGQY
jgi:hypothetical protein